MEHSTDQPSLDERRAHLLAFWLKQRGITCYIHQDRSPWGVRIPLTVDDDRRQEYAQPSLYVLFEGTIEYDRYSWFGALGGFHEDIDDALNGTTFAWHEDLGIKPQYADSNMKHLVSELLPIIHLLKDGVTSLCLPAGMDR